MQQRMSALDSSFLSFETSSTRQVIAGLVTLEAPPHMPSLHARTETLLKVFPRLTMHAELTPAYIWKQSTNFQLASHVQFIHAPEITSQTQLFEKAASVFSSPLDYSKPLWKFVVISSSPENSPETNTQTFNAFIILLHHSFADGLGGLELLRAVSSITLETSTLPTPDFQMAPPLASQPNRSPLKRHTWKSLKKLLKESLRHNPQSPLLGENSPSRFFQTLALPLTEVNRAKSILRGTANALFLTLVSNSIRRYHQVHCTPTKDLMFIMPASTRRPSDLRSLGNHLTAVGAVLPVSLAGQKEQFAQITSTLQRLKSGGAYGAYELLGRINAHLPRWLQRFVCEAQAKKTLCICTNMPFSKHTRYLAGSKITAVYGMPALMRNQGLGFGFVRYGANYHFSIVSDPAIVKNPEAILESVESTFQEMLSK